MGTVTICDRCKSVMEDTKGLGKFSVSISTDDAVVFKAEGDACPACLQKMRKIAAERLTLVEKPQRKKKTEG